MKIKTKYFYTYSFLGQILNNNQKYNEFDKIYIKSITNYKFITYLEMF